MDYRNTKEMNYFGSDLNKFAHKNCTKQMTINNIDYLSYKRDKKTLRIIESKHSKEGMPTSQKEVLDIFAFIFKKLNKRTIMVEYTFECYIHRGDPPYNYSEIEDLVNDKEFTLDNENLVKFLEFKDYQTIEQLNEIHG